MPRADQRLHRRFLGRGERIAGSGCARELGQDGRPGKGRSSPATPRQLVPEVDIVKPGGLAQPEPERRGDVPGTFAVVGEGARLAARPLVVDQRPADARRDRHQHGRAGAKAARGLPIKPCLRAQLGIREARRRWRHGRGRWRLPGLKHRQRDNQANLDPPGDTGRQREVRADRVPDQIVRGLTRGLDGGANVLQDQRFPGIIQVQPHAQLPGREQIRSIDTEVTIGERGGVVLTQIDASRRLRQPRRRNKRGEK